jgi:hypothetical protein
MPEKECAIVAATLRNQKGVARFLAKPSRQHVSISRLDSHGLSENCHDRTPESAPYDAETLQHSERKA